MSKVDLVFEGFEPNENLVIYSQLIFKQIRNTFANTENINTILSHHNDEFICRCTVFSKDPLIIETCSHDPIMALDELDMQLRSKFESEFKERDHFDPTMW